LIWFKDNLKADFKVEADGVIHRQEEVQAVVVVLREGVLKILMFLRVQQER
jgi:hypothetical protein